jgi:uncharacterized membrane protein
MSETNTNRIPRIKWTEIAALGFVLLLAAAVAAFSIGFEVFGMPKNFWRFLLAGIFCMIIFILYLIFALPGRDGKTRIAPTPENLFLAVSLATGLFYAVLLPFLRAPDELGHFYRALAILRGDLLSYPDGVSDLPALVLSEIMTSPRLEGVLQGTGWSLSDAQILPIDNVNMCLYLPLSYLLQVVFMGITGLFTDKVIFLVYCTRFLCGLACTGIVYHAIRRIPVGKWYLMALALMPINMQERFSLAVDNITFAVAVLLVAECLALRYEYLREGRTVTRGRLIELYVTLIFLASCKVVYFLLVLLVLLIPRDAFGSPKRAAFHKMMTIAMTSGISLSWLAFASTYLSSTRAGGNAGEKVIYAITHPLQYILLLIRTEWSWILEGNFLTQTVGRNLASLDLVIAPYWIVMFYVLLVLAFVADFLVLRNRDRKAGIELLGVSMLIAVAVLSSLYVQWTQGAPSEILEVDGIQGRYYSPILPVAVCGLLLFVGRKPRETAEEAAPSRMAFYPAAALLALHISILEAYFQYGCGW